MQGAKTGEQGRQQVGAERGAGAQMQLALLQLGEVTQVAFGGALQGEDAPRIVVQTQTSFGQLHAAWLAIEQAQVEAGFEVANLPRYGRLADVQALGAGADAAGFCHGQKDLEMVQVHG